MTTKDVGLRIRVEKELRQSFVAACKAQNKQASDVLRAFMRTFANQNPDGKQGDLFSAIEDTAERTA